VTVKKTSANEPLLKRRRGYNGIKMSGWNFYSDKIYRKPDYWVDDIRRAGGVSLIEAFVRNYGN
jgi:hypothetical protein